MPILRGVRSVAGLASGFTLFVAGGLAALYVVPTLHAHRFPAGLAAAVVVWSGILLIAWSVSKVEDSSDASEVHLPGMDVEGKD